MKLTIDQRHTAYILILHILKTDLTHDGVCSVAMLEFDIDLDNNYAFVNFKEMLPELWDKRNPGKNEQSCWLWGKRSERIAALEQCIIETSNF